MCKGEILFVARLGRFLKNILLNQQYNSLNTSDCMARGLVYLHNIPCLWTSLVCTVTIFNFCDSNVFVTQLLIFAAGLLNWSLISLINLVTSLILRFTSPKTGNVLSVNYNQATVHAIC